MFVYSFSTSIELKTNECLVNSFITSIDLKTNEC